jgi:GNAT superfamily N-acetyltransferase
LSGARLIEEPIEKPFVKDYDAYAEEKPSRWRERFDLSNWGIFAAFDGAKRIGGAATAWKTPEIFMLEGREDLACLWDLRVAPEYRGKQIGQRLFEYALNWAKMRNCRLFKVETQNINVPACRFYLKQGCELGAINRFAYPDLPNEIQLIWYRKI